MITRAFNFIRGCICITLIIINTLIHSTLTFIFGGLAWLISAGKGAPKPIQACVNLIPTSWSFFNMCVIRISAFGKLKINGHDQLSRKHWYILISNHQSWTDILVLTGVFALNIPPTKFFMKKELLWQLPLAGVCCYLLGYPFMERHTRADIRKNSALKGKDIETTKVACNKFKKLPTTFLNFAEGTRFTKAKHNKQQSPFKHLLKPKAGGTAIVINELHDYLAGVLNVTINYNTENVSIFNLLSGNIRQLSVDYEVLPITNELLGNYYEDRNYRSAIQRWLNDIWERKDQLLDQQDSHDN